MPRAAPAPERSRAADGGQIAAKAGQSPPHGRRNARMKRRPRRTAPAPKAAPQATVPPRAPQLSRRRSPPHTPRRTCAGKRRKE